MPLQEEFEQQGNFLFKYRGTLPLIILFVGIAVYGLKEYQSTETNECFIIENLEIIALAISMLGQAIRIFTVGYTPRHTSGRNTDKQIADEINKTGIYSLVRHPLYLGNFFMWLGIAVLTTNVWFVVSFVFLYWVYYERIMFAEEQFLRGKFGENYLSWAKLTPAFLPLSCKNWKKSDLHFSWKKILKKEKNGFFAVFLVIYIFEAVGKYINEKDFILDGWLFYCTIGSGVLYFILKFTRKWTSLLDEEGR